MKIENIPADENLEMTSTFHRAFNLVGCDPMCHCCETMLPIGVMFKLATVLDANRLYGEAAYFTREILLGNRKATSKDYRSYFKEKIREEFKIFDTNKYKELAVKYKLINKDVMLCATCTAKDYKNKLIKECDAEITRMETPRKGGCFRVNGKIIT